MEEKIDIRIIKTQRAIKNVFFELMDEIGFSKISVKKIIERAEINRSTFYSHYVDKFDLLDKMEDELLMGFKCIGSDAPFELIATQDWHTEAIMSYFNRFVTYVHENAKIFTLLVGEKGDPAFINKLSEIIKSIWSERNLFDGISILQNYALTALIGMMTNLIAEWVKGDFRETPEEFMQIVITIVKDLSKNIYAKV